MPTARELLEQADALMRRNRSPVADDIPVLTEAVSPQPALRVPLRPSPESLPPLPAEAPAGGPVDVIPTLTDKVPPSEPDGAGAMTAEGEPSDWLDLDEGEPSITGKAPISVMSVPDVVTAEALRDVSDADTDAPPITEEIELAPAAEAEFEAELGAVEPPLPAAGEPDVPAPVPADVPAPLPPVDEADASASAPLAEDVPVARTPWPVTELPPEVDALPALAAEAEMAFESPSTVSWNVEALLADNGTAAQAAAAPVTAEEAPTPFAAPPATEADEPVLEEPPPLTMANEDEPPSAVSAVSDDVSLAPSPAEAFAAVPESAIEATPAHELQGGDATDVAPEDDYPVEPGSLAHTGAPGFAALHPPVAPPAAGPAAADDAARWEAMAEEIRMQVLQRIDLFTDTGLREQLGARLQPIVDRASADLVRTINQHVGELLRAYVAEAIEREIERWKLSQR